MTVQLEYLLILILLLEYCVHVLNTPVLHIVDQVTLCIGNSYNSF